MFGVSLRVYANRQPFRAEVWMSDSNQVQPCPCATPVFQL